MKIILILSAGRRVELVKCFKKAAQKLNLESKIIAADMSNTASALYVADEFRLIPPIHADQYIEVLLQICKNENVDLVVPTIDTELLILAENKDYIENNSNALILISKLEVIKVCRDKTSTYHYFINNGFLAPKIITKERILNKDYKFPLFIKPLNGSSSINAFKVNNEIELEFFLKYIENPIVQDCISGDEYTIDVFCDFNAKIISITPRIRIATRSGEISKGKICKDEEIINSVARLIKILKPIGHITVQCMKTKRGIEYIEVNPRFGGGAPMSIKAGADSCEYLFRLLGGEHLTMQDGARNNLFFSRFDDCICLDENMVPVHD